MLATGHYRNGVLLTPITADVITRLLTTGELDPLAEPFGLDRFAALSPPLGRPRDADDRHRQRRAARGPPPVRLLDVLDLPAGEPTPAGIAVALDGEVVPARPARDAPNSREGARVEIVTAVQGG